LKGTKIRTDAEANDCICTQEPPYEVLATKWLSYSDILCLKRVEHVLETYYNSGKYTLALEYSLAKSGLTPFDYFDALAEFWAKNTIPGASYGHSKLYTLFYQFHAEQIEGDSELFNALLCFEQLKSNKTAQLGAWAKLPQATKQFYDAAWAQVRKSGCLTEKQLAMKQKDVLQYVRIVRLYYDVFTHEKRDIIAVFDYENKKTYSLAVENYEENNL